MWQIDAKLREDASAPGEGEAPPSNVDTSRGTPTYAAQWEAARAERAKLVNTPGNPLYEFAQALTAKHPEHMQQWEAQAHELNQRLAQKYGISVDDLNAVEPPPITKTGAESSTPQVTTGAPARENPAPATPNPANATELPPVEVTADAGQPSAAQRTALTPEMQQTRSELDDLLAGREPAAHETTPEPASEPENEPSKAETGAQESSGPFGPVYTRFRHDAQGAISHLLQVKNGEAIGALHHAEVGDIDLVWGKEGNPSDNYKNGYGLAKIAAKHPAVLGHLQTLLDGMHVDPNASGPNRTRLVSRDGRAAVRLDWDGQDKKWLLSAFEFDREPGLDTRTDTAKLGREGDKLASQPGADKDTPQSHVARGAVSGDQPPFGVAENNGQQGNDLTLGESGKRSVPPSKNESRSDANEGETREQLANEFYRDLPNEIGWETEGGHIIREADTGGLKPEVVGRTKWTVKPGPFGESSLWAARPEKGGRITPEQAKQAFAKEARGEKLNAREQRFIDHAHAVADDYADQYITLQREFERDQADIQGASWAEAMRELDENGAHVPAGDEAEAVTLEQWVSRAYDAGATSEDIIDITWDGSEAEQARRLARLITDLEDSHGTDTGAKAGRDSGGTETPREGAAAAHTAPQGQGATEAARGAQEVGQARGDGGEPLESRRVRDDQTTDLFGATRKATPERQPQPTDTTSDMFGGPTTADRVGAVERAKDARRNGKAGGREDTGEGGLFDGERPEQTDIERPRDLHEPTEAEADAAERQLGEQMRAENAAQGERDADRLSLKRTTDAMFPGQKITYVHDEDGIHENTRKRLKPLERGHVRKGFYDPTTGRVYILTRNVRTPKEAAWVVAHEIGGHKAFRAWVAHHANVKVGMRSAIEALNKATDMARQNPTVAKLADVIARKRKNTSPRTAVEEALAELQAATLTGDWARIKEHYGVDVPEGMKPSLKRSMANYIKRVTRIVNAIFHDTTGEKGTFSDEDVRDMLADTLNHLDDDAHATGHADDALDQTAYHGTADDEPYREARTFEDARKQAEESFVGKPIENDHGLPPATVSKRV